MSVRVALAAAPKPPLVPGLLAALRAAVRHVSWRVVGTTFAIMVALDAWLVFDIVYQIGTKPPGAEGYISGAIINLLMAFCIMFTTLVADELVARGAKRLPAYAWAVVIGCAAAVLAQWEVHQWLHLRSWNELPGIPHELAATQPAGVFFEYLIWGSIIVLIYVNRRTALLATARLNAAQVQRTDVQRRTLESRLQALQARVEPQFLFNTLAQVRALYESDPAKGSQMLGDLIVYLRAALPHLRDSTSTLEQELKLVGAYLNIIQVRLGTRLAFDIDMPQSAQSARMPPMILLSLLDQALNDYDRSSSSGAGTTIRIAAHRSASELHVEIASSGGAFRAAYSGTGLSDIQKRLHGLYGNAGRLVFASAGRDSSQVVIEIPYEPTDGRYR
jgi:Putative regulator of cell autolysis